MTGPAFDSQEHFHKVGVRFGPAVGVPYIGSLRDEPRHDATILLCLLRSKPAQIGPIAVQSKNKATNMAVHLAPKKRSSRGGTGSSRNRKRLFQKPEEALPLGGRWSGIYGDWLQKAVFRILEEPLPDSGRASSVFWKSLFRFLGSFWTVICSTYGRRVCTDPSSLAPPTFRRSPLLVEMALIAPFRRVEKTLTQRDLLFCFVPPLF
jgi:hypothetical protein